MYTARDKLIFNLRDQLHFAQQGSDEESRVLKAIDALTLTYEELELIVHDTSVRSRRKEVHQLLHSRLIDALEAKIERQVNKDSST